MAATALSIVETILSQFRRQVSALLPKPHLLSEVHLSVRLGTYRDCIAPYFVPWMAHAWSRCCPAAQQFVGDSLLCKMKENHPAMIRRYVNQTDYATEWMVQQVRTKESLLMFLSTITSITQEDALEGLLILAGIESASLKFIPWMEEAGKLLGFTDFEYIEKHKEDGEAHVQDLAEAVAIQATDMNVDLAAISSFPLQTARDLLRGIFNAVAK
jgi:hypothetical protein